MKILNSILILISTIAFLSLILSNAYAFSSSKIIIEGVGEDMQESIRSAIDELSDEALSDLNQYEESARQEILTVLQMQGYYEPQVQSHFTQKHDLLQATFRIQLGKPIHIQQIFFRLEGEGEKDLSLQHLFQAFTLKPQDIFNHEH